MNAPMRHLWRLLALAACLLGCGRGLIAYDDGSSESSSGEVETTGEPPSETSTSTSTSTSTETDTGPEETETDTGPAETETDTETGDGDGDGDGGLLCDCAELDLICTSDAELAVPGCEQLPNPCGVVNGDAAAAECVLQLLIAGEPARFRYDVSSAQGCGGGYYNYDGWFYILTPTQGLDSECVYDECDNGPGMPGVDVAEATFYTIAGPAHFMACLGGNGSAMTNCIFNGLTAGAAVPMCGG